jgi:predicted RNA-binding protein with PUA-like domain
MLHMSNVQNFWLIKSEGDCYTIDQLKKDKKTPWSGVRNYLARNFMRDQMSVGDMALFYHSQDKPSGVYGLAQVCSTPHPDQTQFDPKDEHFDPKAKRDNPTWMCVDFKFVEKFEHPISLSELKLDPKLEGMGVRRKGDRLSIQPVSKKHFEYVVKLARKG